MARPSQPEVKNLPARRDENTGLQQRQQAIVKELNARRRGFEAVLPKEFGPDKLVALVLESMRKNPAIANCDPDSVLKAVYEAAKLGLEPDTPLALCHLIPYKNECQFVLGYQGAKVLAARSGLVAKVWAEHRYERDFWRMQRGTDPRIEHVPADGDRGRYMGTYAVAEYSDRNITPSFEWISVGDMAKLELHAHGLEGRTAEQLEEYRETVANDPKQWKKQQKPWHKWRDRMRLKSAIKRLCKQLVSYDAVAVALRRAIQLDDVAEGRGSQAKMIDLPPSDVAGSLPPPRSVEVTVRGSDSGTVEGVEFKPSATLVDDEDEGADDGVPPPDDDSDEDLVDDDPPEITDEQLDELTALATKIGTEHADLRGRVVKVTMDPRLSFDERMQALREIERVADGKLSPEDEAQMELAQGETEKTTKKAKK
jgi:recombination protein RecT